MTTQLESPFSTPIPSQTPLWDTVEQSGDSSIDFSLRKPSQLLLSQHTYLTSYRSSIMSRENVGCGGGVPVQRGGYHRPDSSDVAVTISTKFSIASASSVSNVVAGANNNTSQKSKKISRRRLKFGGFSNILKFPIVGSRRRKPPSESQLRKKLKKFAERGDWDGVRKLISDYEFPEIVRDKKQQRGSKRDSIVPENHLQEKPVKADRRPSYGSRTGDRRRSFSGKESSAAAAVIKSALLEESSSAKDLFKHDRPDIGENVLHDICRCRPPLDVLETLLNALRHRRRGSTTSGTDDRGRTPLHLAAEGGASPEVIDALVRADPCPASVGDADGRSPLHLAVKFLAHDGGYHHSTTTSNHHHGRKCSSKNTTTHHQEGIKLSTPAETLERIYQTILILKDTMLTYPGKVDFKDEDITGYSPLDYAIDGNITKEELINSLVRRKEPLIRSTSRTIRRYNRCLTMRSSFNDDHQDIEILCRLEQDEIEARRHRIEMIKARRQKELMNDALFDVFGIDQHAVNKQVVEEEPSLPEEELSLPKVRNSSQDEIKSLDKVAPEHQQAGHVVTSDDDIYNQHLQDYLEDFMDDHNQHLQEYLDDFMDDLDGCDLKEHCDEDEFDILEDPSLAGKDEAATRIDDPSAFLNHGDGNYSYCQLPVIIVTEDDDCVSMVSEITAPLT